MKKIKEILKNNYFSITIFILLVLLSFFFIPVGDDWSWGSSIGLKRLNNFFSNYNGRYFSNILIIILSRINILRIIIIAITVFLIIVLIKRITNSNQKIYPLLFLIILSIPPTIFKNTIAWSSGFTNYVFPTLTTLIFFNYIKNINHKDCENKNNLIMLLLGFISCLIVEHLTIYNVLLSMFINIYSYIKYKKISKTLLFYSIGAISGTILMFSNSSYYNIAEGTDFYRTINQTNIITKSLNTYFNVVYKNFIFNNYITNILIVLSMYYIVYNSKQNKVILKTNTTISTLYVIYTIIKIINPRWMIFGQYTMYFEGIITIIYVISIMLNIIFTDILTRKSKEKILFFLISSMVMILPLLIVTPVTPRCFFPSYIVFVLAIIELINTLNINIMKFNIPILTLALSFYIFWLSISSYNYLINTRRTKYIYDQISTGATTIRINKLPYEEYLGCDFGSYPKNNSLWQDNYKEYYKIDKDIQIILTD